MQWPRPRASRTHRPHCHTHRHPRRRPLHRGAATAPAVCRRARSQRAHHMGQLWYQRKGRWRRRWRWRRGRRGGPSRPCRRRPSRAAQCWYLRRAEGATSERRRRRERLIGRRVRAVTGLPRTFRRAARGGSWGPRGPRRTHHPPRPHTVRAATAGGLIRERESWPVAAGTAGGQEGGSERLAAGGCCGACAGRTLTCGTAASSRHAGRRALAAHLVRGRARRGRARRGAAVALP